MSKISHQAANISEMPAGGLEQARQIMRGEAEAIAAVADGLDDNFTKTVEMLYACKGNVVLTGIGKAGIIGQKISATLASTGTPSHFLHAAEAVHGDLGRLRNDDVAVVLSHSGESEEIVRLIALIKQIGTPMIAITGNPNSPLAKHSDLTISLGKLEEVCPLGLAPSTSTTCMLAVGDAIALTIMKLRNFQSEDYAKYHPGGALGRKLITVEQAALFRPGTKLPIATDQSTIQQAIETAEADVPLRHGCILIVNKDGKLAGLVTDGDLRRAIKECGDKVHSRPVKQIMTKNPKVIHPDTLASGALAIFHKNRIDEIPVVDHDGKPVGLIDVQDVVALKVLE